MHFRTLSSISILGICLLWSPCLAQTGDVFPDGVPRSNPSYPLPPSHVPHPRQENRGFISVGLGFTGPPWTAGPFARVGFLQRHPVGGAATIVAWSLPYSHWETMGRRCLADDEDWCCTLSSGRTCTRTASWCSLALENEYDLGYGFVIGFDIDTAVVPQPHLSFEWYPWEDVKVLVGHDPLTGGLGCSLTQIIFIDELLEYVSLARTGAIRR